MAWRAKALAACAIVCCAAMALAAPPTSYRDRLPEDEIVYFVLPDRFENGDPSNDTGGIAGGKLQHGFDPTDKAFYHGGDIAGLIKHLDYIQGLGATALWVGPIFKNKPVQGAPGDESAGYHGYWITDFTRVDPHFGTNADFKALVDAAHARGMKVYMDIVVNHTADVIQYRECVGKPCPYRSMADYPYTRRGGLNGGPINSGFMGDDAVHQTQQNFAHLTDPRWAYTPFVTPAEAHVKVPDWLNNPIYYHNRGDTSFRGENSTYGDFSGLDDLFTEHPRVVQGFIDIYGKWIDAFGVDGFRIDTAKHVNPELWQAFVPAMLARAKARGIPHFHIFGEVSENALDSGVLPRFARVAGMPATLDFQFFDAVTDVVARNRPTAEFARVFAGDDLWPGGAATALQLPTFTGNHDNGRLAYFVRVSNPHASLEEQYKRTLLGHAMLLTLRGAPVIYSGDEQGFVGHGGDQDAREDMFGSKVGSYNDNVLLGTGKTTTTPSFDARHPLYLAIQELAALRSAHVELRRGVQTLRASGETPGLFAVTRRVPGQSGETLIAFNSSPQPVTSHVVVDSASPSWLGLHGQCAASSDAPGSYQVSLAPFDFIICTTIKVDP
jgi:glycosidase